MVKYQNLRPGQTCPVSLNCFQIRHDRKYQQLLEQLLETPR